MVSAIVSESTDMLMLEHSYLEALSRTAATQTTHRDPTLSQVVKAVLRGEYLPRFQDYSPHSDKYL